MSLTIDRTESFEQQAVRAALPGGLFSSLVPQPSRSIGVSGEIENALNARQQLRVDLRVNDNDQRNLGIGNFDLTERAFSRSSQDSVLRISESGPLARTWFGESRLQVRRTDTDAAASLEAPTVRVLP
jgi:hypothetical protein